LKRMHVNENADQIGLIFANTNWKNEQNGFETLDRQ
jgi:hypothetical protein